MASDLFTFDCTMAPRAKRQDWRKLTCVEGHTFPVWAEWFNTLDLAQFHAVAQDLALRSPRAFPDVHTAQPDHDVVLRYGRLLTTWLAVAWEPYPTERQKRIRRYCEDVARGLLAHVASQGYAYVDQGGRMLGDGPAVHRAKLIEEAANA